MKQRIQRSFLILIVASLVAAITGSLANAGSNLQRLSIGTAWASFLLLIYTISIGPIATLRGKRYPTSTETRRDTGIGAAILAITHTAIGLQLHVGGDVARYFIPPPSHASLRPSQIAFFGANHAGLVSLIVLLALLTISNNVSLRKLGSARWKEIQGNAHVALALAALHGFLYELIERRTPPFLITLAIATAAIAAVRILASSRKRTSSR